MTVYMYCWVTVFRGRGQGDVGSKPFSKSVYLSSTMIVISSEPSPHFILNFGQVEKRLEIRINGTINHDVFKSGQMWKMSRLSIRNPQYILSSIYLVEGVLLHDFLLLKTFIFSRR